ncbi:hypothetical protein F9C07_2028491, partial [Aspergillus flavus]
AYVDDSLLSSGKISRAAILGQQGRVWGISSGYQLSLQPYSKERYAVIDAYNNLKHTISSGLKLAEKKFSCLKADGRSIY